MFSLGLISRSAGPAIVAGFCLVIAWNILTGRISLTGLLSGDRANGETYFSWGRVQFLAVLVYIAGLYLFHVYRDPTRFPNVPNTSVALLAGSSALYTSEKAWAMLFSRTGLSTRRTR